MTARHKQGTFTLPFDLPIVTLTGPLMRGPS